MSFRPVILFAALAVAGCEEGKPLEKPAEYGILRMKLFQQCMAQLPKTQAVGGESEWDEAAESCARAAYYVTNTCDDERACLDALEGRTSGNDETVDWQPVKKQEASQ